MPCRNPDHRRYATLAIACVLCAAARLDEHPQYHQPEPGAYRPAPGPAYSISSNYGGTAIATAVSWSPFATRDPSAF